MIEVPRFTQAELLAEARGLGFDVSKGTLERYVTLGLLDRAEGRGRGRAKGIDWTWGENQRQIWLTLLRHRQSTPSVVALANIPVSIWLFWGDTYVPVRQICKAIESWAGVGQASRRQDYPAMATRWVGDLARPDASKRDRRDLEAALAEAARTRRWDREYIAELVERVVGPPDDDASFDGPRAMLVLEARWLVSTDAFHGLSDDMFHWARALYLVTRADYERTRAALRQDQRFGRLHDAAATFDVLAVSACQDLALILGLALSRPDAPGLPEQLQPRRWAEGDMALLTRTSLPGHVSGLTSQQGKLHIEVEIIERSDPAL